MLRLTAFDPSISLIRTIIFFSNQINHFFRPRNNAMQAEPR